MSSYKICVPVSAFEKWHHDATKICDVILRFKVPCLEGVPGENIYIFICDELKYISVIRLARISHNILSQQQNIFRLGRLMVSKQFCDPLCRAASIDGRYEVVYCYAK